MVGGDPGMIGVAALQAAAEDSSPELGFVTVHYLVLVDHLAFHTKYFFPRELKMAL